MLNPAGHRILGDRAAAAAGADRRPAAPTCRRWPRWCAMPRCAATALRCRAATSRPASVGGPSHLGVTLSPWTGGAAGETGVICLFTDLSRVVTLEEQLRLKDALARLGELTAGLAHEFRNGLATIHGYARLLDPGGAAGAAGHLRRPGSAPRPRRSASSSPTS